jgi:RNA polymerase sigma-70 factor (ECF subfamily)
MTKPNNVNHTLNSEQTAEQRMESLLSLKPMMIASLSKMVSRERAKDITQEAYIALYLKLQEHELSSPIGYLITTAKRMALSSLRHDKVRSDFTERQEQSANILSCTIEKHAIGAQAKQRLIIAINKLPPVCRQVFILRKIEEKSHAEIAQLMGISKKTVENHLAKGLQLCRKYMVEIKTELGERRVS